MTHFLPGFTLSHQLQKKVTVCISLCTTSANVRSGKRCVCVFIYVSTLISRLVVMVCKNVRGRGGCVCGNMALRRKKKKEGGCFWIVAAAGWLLGWFPWQPVFKKKKKKSVYSPSLIPVLMLATKEQRFHLFMRLRVINPPPNSKWERLFLALQIRNMRHFHQIVVFLFLFYSQSSPYSDSWSSQKGFWLEGNKKAFLDLLLQED